MRTGEGAGKEPCGRSQLVPFCRDVNKDKDPQGQGPDPQGQRPDPQGPGQELEICPKESLRTRTRTTARQIILIAHINLSNVQW